MRVDFSKIEVPNIDDTYQNADIRKSFGTQLYTQGQSKEESELGHAIWHQKDEEPLELTDEQIKIAETWIKRIPSYVARSALLKAIGKCE